VQQLEKDYDEAAGEKLQGLPTASTPIS